MASPPALTVLYGFSVLFFCCLQLLGTATNAQPSQSTLERLAATAFFPAVLLTLVLTPLLSFAHVRALGRGGAAGGRRLVAGLAKATVLAATVALACAVLLLGADGAVVQLGADGHLDRGRGDVARLNIK
jgi:hypothetical protein